MPEVHVSTNGVITVDGKTITPTEVARDAPIVLKDTNAVLTELKNRKSYTLKNAEKLLVYGAALVASTNGFTAARLPLSLREWLLGASGLVLAAIHSSTPVV